MVWPWRRKSRRKKTQPNGDQGVRNTTGRSGPRIEEQGDEWDEEQAGESGGDDDQVHQEPGGEEGQ